MTSPRHRDERAKVKRFRKSTRNEAKESSCPEEKDRKKMSPKNKDKVSETEKSHRGIKERVKSKHKEKGKVNQGKGRERHKKRRNTEKRDVQSVSVPLLSEQKGRCSPQASMISSDRMGASRLSHSVTSLVESPSKEKRLKCFPSTPSRTTRSQSTSLPIQPDNVEEREYVTSLSPPVSSSHPHRDPHFGALRSAKQRSHRLSLELSSFSPHEQEEAELIGKAFRPLAVSSQVRCVGSDGPSAPSSAQRTGVACVGLFDYVEDDLPDISTPDDSLTSEYSLEEPFGRTPSYSSVSLSPRGVSQVPSRSVSDGVKLREISEKYQKKRRQQMQMQLQKKQATSSPSREKSVLANHLTLDLVFNAQDDSIFLDRMIHSLPNSSVTSPSSLAPVPTLAPSFPSPSTIEHVAPHQSSPSCSMCRAAACTLSANSDQENGVGECLSEEESASSTGLPSSPLRGAKQPVLIFLSVLQEELVRTHQRHGVIAPTVEVIASFTNWKRIAMHWYSGTATSQCNDSEYRNTLNSKGTRNHVAALCTSEIHPLLGPSPPQQSLPSSPDSLSQSPHSFPLSVSSPPSMSATPLFPAHYWLCFHVPEGMHQFKFIVDGTYTLLHSYPICQDDQGNWNHRLDAAQRSLKQLSLVEAFGQDCSSSIQA